MKSKLTSIIKIIFMLSILQLCLFGLQQFFFLFFERTNFSDRMVSMISMLILAAILLFLAKTYKLDLSIFPEKFNLPYIIFSVIYVLIIISTPSNFSGGIGRILLLIYSSLVVPLYEELVFRGLVWNLLEKVLKNEIAVYLLNTLLFGLWHLGYVSSLAFRISDGLINALVWKVIIGLCFGLVLGLLRLKTKNCFSTMLLHGIMNVFGR